MQQTSCAHRRNAKSSLRMRVSRDMYPYVKFKYISQFLTPNLPIHYTTFNGLRWRIRDVLSVTSNVKGQIERKISKSKNLQNFNLLGALEIRGIQVAIFTAKGTSLRESTSIEPFCVKIGWGVWPLGLRGGKVRKSREAPIGMKCRR